MAGSIFGGRWSDAYLRKMKAKGFNAPEVRTVWPTIQITVNIRTDKAAKHENSDVPLSTPGHCLRMACTRACAHRSDLHCTVLRWVFLNVRNKHLYMTIA
jgi:hypothetical protein